MMLNFEPVDISHRERAGKYLCCKNAIHAEGSFNALYAWAKFFNTQLCFYEDFLFIRSGKDENNFYQMPRGEGDPVHAIELVCNDAKERGTKPTLISVTECMRERLENIMPDAFEFSEDRDSFDYVYNAKDLIELAGRTFHQKRNNVNKFKKFLDGRYEYQNFTSDDLAEVYEFQKYWLEKNINDDNRASLEGEMTVIERIFKNFDELGYVGGLIRVDEKIAAYSIGSRLCSDAFLVSVEKADIQYPGIYQAINQFFAASHCTDVRYINREDDAGSEGLRKAKLSYHPEILLTKYRAVWKRD